MTGINANAYIIISLAIHVRVKIVSYNYAYYIGNYVSEENSVQIDSRFRTKNIVIRKVEIFITYGGENHVKEKLRTQKCFKHHSRATVHHNHHAY